MKKISFIIVLSLTALSFNSFSQIKVNSSGQVGINQNYPTYNLDWFGTGRFWSIWGQLIFDSSGSGGVVTMHPASDWVGCIGRSDKQFNNIYVDHLIARAVTTTSDETLKENIVNLESSLSKLKRLRGVKYDIKEDYFRVEDKKLKKELVKKGKNNIGFLAQELEEVFPEIVFFDNSSNLYSVNYIELIPVLVEALKEQQEIIENLSAQIQAFEQDCCNNKLKSLSLTTETTNELMNEDAKLYQNTPNPFTNQTEVRCFIPKEAVKSMLHIFNMNGTQLEQINITGTGNQQITINGNRLKPGMYLYSLVIDSKEIDTKRMILTK